MWPGCQNKQNKQTNKYKHIKHNLNHIHNLKMRFEIRFSAICLSVNGQFGFNFVFFIVHYTVHVSITVCEYSYFYLTVNWQLIWKTNWDLSLMWTQLKWLLTVLWIIIIKLRAFKDNLNISCSLVRSWQNNVLKEVHFNWSQFTTVCV